MARYINKKKLNEMIQAELRESNQVEHSIDIEWNAESLGKSSSVVIEWANRLMGFMPFTDKLIPADIQHLQSDALEYIAGFIDREELRRRWPDLRWHTDPRPPADPTIKIALIDLEEGSGDQ